MKIEKISDIKIKCVLEKKDLSERNIKVAELAYGSDKAHKLFKEMMDRAYRQFDFDVANEPLIVEAIPMPFESIMIILTKVKDLDEFNKKFKLGLSDKERAMLLKNNLFDNIDDFLEDEYFEKKDKNSDTHSNILIYSLVSLDDVILLSKRISHLTGKSSLYKDSDIYFIVLENFKHENIDLIAQEYGLKHVEGLISKYYLIEHGETLIKKNATKVLANM